MPDPFVTVDDLSDWIGRELAADTAAIIAVDAACDMVRTLADQTFNRGTTTVTLDGTGTDCLLLPELPVNTAGTVVLAGGTLTANTDYVLAGGGRLIRMGGTAYTTFSSYVSVWPAGRQNVRVTYDHGYEVAGTVNDVPRDVRIVALSLAQRMVLQGPAMTESVAGQSIGYATPSTNLTAGEMMILQKYRPRA